MTPEILIGIAGKAGTGKSTLARVLSVAYAAQPVAFADSLKAGAYRLYGRKGWFPQEHEEIRHWLQHAGDGAREKHFHDIWVEVFDSLYGRLPRLVVGDVRYPNEVQYIQKRGGVVVYLDDGTDAQDKHPSENLDWGECNALVEGETKFDIHRKALSVLRHSLPFTPRPIRILHDAPQLPILETDVNFPVHVLRTLDWLDYQNFIPKVDIVACALPDYAHRLDVVRGMAKPHDVLVIPSRKEGDVEAFWKEVQTYFHPDMLFERKETQ